MKYEAAMYTGKPIALMSYMWEYDFYVLHRLSLLQYISIYYANIEQMAALKINLMTRREKNESTDRS